MCCDGSKCYVLDLTIEEVQTSKEDNKKSE